MLQERCAAENDVNFTAVHECVNGPLGEALEEKAGEFPSLRSLKCFSEATTLWFWMQGHLLPARKDCCATLPALICREHHCGSEAQPHIRPLGRREWSSAVGRLCFARAVRLRCVHRQRAAPGMLRTASRCGALAA